MNENQPNKKEILKKKILEELDYTKELSDDEIKDIIDYHILLYHKTNYIGLQERQILRKELFYAIRKWDILQEIMEDDRITEIMVNGLEKIFVEKDGKLYPYEKRFESMETLHHVIQQMAAGCNRIINEASPVVDARLEDGSRVNIVLGSIALNGPVITIRRFPAKSITIKQLIINQSITKEAADCLKKLVKAGYNLLISGGTGSGKTTFLNALSEFIPSEQRIITIEDNAELQIGSIPNLITLEARNANTEGCKEITIRDLIKTALRMRPDRLIIGEVRGAESVDLLQALNTGHKGSMCTIHANSTSDSISRLTTTVLMGMELPLKAIKRQITSGIDIIIHLGRLRDGSRKVLEIAEVNDLADEDITLNMLYRFVEEGQSIGEKVIGRLKREGELCHEEKLKESGIV